MPLMVSSLDLTQLKNKPIGQQIEINQTEIQRKEYVCIGGWGVETRTGI